MNLTERKSDRVIFRGKGFRTTKFDYIFLLLFFVPVFFLSFGQYWFRFFALAFPGAVIFMHLSRKLQSLQDWFFFDDVNQKIMMSWRHSIPYRKVKAIRITETPTYLSVTVERGWFVGTNPLLQSLDLSGRPKLIEEFGKRFPEEMIRQQKGADWKRVLAGVLVPLILVVWVVGLTLWIRNTFPEVRRYPQEREWKLTEDFDHEQEWYGLGGFSFSLPQSFQLVKQEDGFLCLTDSTRETRLRVVVTSSVLKSSGRLSRSLFNYGFGIRDCYDLHKFAYYARFGVLPLFWKAMMLDEYSSEGIYEVEQNGLKGFLTSGLKDEENVAQLMLVDKERKRKINFYFSSCQQIDEQIFAAIINSIKTAGESGSK